MKNHEVNIFMLICNESCLRPAAESSWLCLPLSVCQKRNYPPGSLTKYQCNSLWLCHLVLWAWWISSGNLPFVCPLTGHIQHCLLTCHSYSWLDVGFNRRGTWVSTFSSIVIWSTEGKWKLPDMLRGDGWGGPNISAIGLLHAKFTAWGSSHSTLHPFSPPGKVWSPPGKALLPQATNDSELKRYWCTAAHGAFATTICWD